MSSELEVAASTPLPDRSRPRPADGTSRTPILLFAAGILAGAVVMYLLAARCTGPVVKELALHAQQEALDAGRLLELTDTMARSQQAVGELQGQLWRTKRNAASLVAVSWLLACVVAVLVGQHMSGQILALHLERDKLRLQLADAEEGFDVTLKVSLEALQMLQGDALQSWLSRLACLRLILLGEPLRTLLQAVANGTSRDAPAEAMGHPTWPLLLKPQQESLTVLLPIRLSDAQDAMLLQAFAQEFAQARRSGAAGTQNAPECSYSQPLAAPFALSPEHQQLVQEAVCSVAFVYHRQHVRTPALVEQSVIQLTSFHAYLGDHVKSFKAHIHSKMRMRMNSMMHTLAMARVEP
ncbi:hypothetical protein WJX72_007119 [[Myrmecia] bisecta]|uniref:Arp2/3 complex 34 kDa subunit n=1 Tax=[Myrmecia] bisecta TaxID=41462 RepID=A0AAW1Q4K5_9CHLO